MSYEGYEQVICVKGHLYAVDCYDYSFKHTKCPHCGGKTAWTHSVDQTNGEGHAASPVMKTPAVHFDLNSALIDLIDDVHGVQTSASRKLFKRILANTIPRRLEEPTYAIPETIGHRHVNP